MEAEVTDIVGPKVAWYLDRIANRHGHEAGSMTLEGRRVLASWPCARSLDGKRNLWVLRRP